MRKYSLAALAATAAISFAAPASAATVVPLLGTSNFTAPFQFGIPTYLDLGSSVPAPFTPFSGPAGGGEFNFTFSVATPLKVFTQLQINGSDVFGYSLYKVGVIPSVFDSTTPNGVTSILGSGDYFLSVTLPSHTTGVNNISGLVSTSAVPEPATWATMILGFFGLGAMLRRRRMARVATAAA